MGVILLWGALLMLGREATTAAAFPHLGALSFKVLNGDGTDVIGHSRYELTRGNGNLLIGRGAAHFNDGEHDLEYDTLEARPGQPPAMLALDHTFFNADGSRQREISADFRTGQASCTRFENGVAQTDTAKIDFTPDSYGGSAVVLPLEQYLAQGASEPIKLRALNCIPKPRLIAVKAHVQQPAQWSHYPAPTVEVDIKPDLGWLDAIVAPFVPELHAWFDPSENWILAGGEFSRYFRGPHIMLVREIPAEIRNGGKRKATEGN